jgi:hypothetical protein
MMEEDQLIFLGAAILLSQKGRDPDDTELRTAMSAAHKLLEVVKKQRDEIREKQRLPLVEYYKEKSEKKE